jgi:hypothetical protein
MTLDKLTAALRVVAEATMAATKQPNLDPEDYLERLISLLVLLHPQTGPAIPDGRRWSAVGDALALMTLNRVKEATAAWKALSPAEREAISSGADLTHWTGPPTSARRTT